jgi:uncharacterized membrane protein YhaH (DUF805 family)
MEWYLKVVKQHYADFGGRARRQEYWMFTLIYMVIYFGLAMGGGGLSYAMNSSLPMVLPGIFLLAMFIPSLAVAVRRLHDTGKSGWFMLVGFVPFIGGLILLYFMVIDSAPGNNEYGPNPKGA